MTDTAADAGLATHLQRYLQQARSAVLRALDGVSEYDARRPMTPSGTNLLGLVKHLIGVEAGYLGECVGRKSSVRLPWVEDESIWESADMWATADESREYLLDLYAAVCANSDESIATLPLDTPALVPWWPAERRDTTFGHVIIRMITDTAQHAGHADILREMIDGRGGQDHDDIGDAAWWEAHIARIQVAADRFRSADGG